MSDLFQNSGSKDSGYSAKDIEVLEGLEPVRHRPGMYIGGTDERAYHHLVAEVLDNSMDEAVAGHASRIELDLLEDGSVTVRDNGRGIPIDPHPKYKDKSALEVILTTLHSGGKFSGKVYATSGGLHGVGISVVNALSENLVVEVARERTLYRQTYSRGHAQGPLAKVGDAPNRRGTSVTFRPDTQIFGDRQKFDPAVLFRMARSKAYLFKGVEIRWTCPKSLIKDGSDVPEKSSLHFPGGLKDYLTATLGARATITPRPFAASWKAQDGVGQMEWAIHWPADGDGFCSTYCNTVPTPQGGTHESAMRSALAKSLRAYGDLVGNKKASQITGDDITGEACIMLSVFIPDPQFQGQTKEKLVSIEAGRMVELALKDRFDHWLSEDPASANDLLERILERVDERQKRKQQKEQRRKTPTRKLRLPGKLADCSDESAEDTEIFLVEGDSAGGSAKQARNRKTQAILPMKGKILNVASASADKLKQNQELKDIIQALGCGTRADFNVEKLRYERVIIMTDADVDGAHIASLLMTFFYREMPGLVEAGRLFLAQPPLYRLSQGGKSVYAMDDAAKDAALKTEFKPNAKVDISRFKGLGEMPPAQLRDTTMDPSKRTLLRVDLPNRSREEELEESRRTAKMVETLMGKKPEMRFQFIQENAQFIDELDV
ncbi:DNA topoisomerase IV subunit B [Rhodospirillaceae bacterium KN72]|uniref:DNA topoisomerase 4 subunit B n=1 Tax=Pacificispira spongiicola TaxID=2729598 RepID=A0A7Y0E2J8_9PROT|nr:DNA topoisomerase IV subunit B [Pacificispira spongiicola]NMM46060.1 DNA topoisomerase IV subunit B [Pacificispira spongiicola]